MPQVFFLTGSSRGLGRQVAEAALAAGHYLVATARNPASLADLVDRYGGQILPVALDVTDSEAAPTWRGTSSLIVAAPPTARFVWV